MASISYLIVDKDETTNYGELVIKLTISRSVRPRFHTGLHVNADYLQVVEENEFGNVYDVVAPIINWKKTNVKIAMETREVRDKLHTLSNKILRICEYLQSTPDLEVTEDNIRKALSRLGEFTHSDEDLTFLYMTEILGGTVFVEDVWADSEPFFSLLKLMLKEKTMTSSNPKDYVRNYMALYRMAKRFELYTRLSSSSQRSFVLDPRIMTNRTMEDFRTYVLTEQDLYITKPDIFDRIAEIDPDCMQNVIHHRQKIRHKGENYVKVNLEYLRTFFHWLNNKEYTDNWPFRDFRIGHTKYEEPIFLTIEERNLVADYNLSFRPRLAEIRDAFIFQCLTGCRYGDLCQLTHKNIQHGNLIFVPQKTSGSAIPPQVVVPLSDRAKQMIKRNRDKERDELFNLPSIFSFNRDLQIILTICGIQRPVLFHNPKTGELSYRPLCEVATSHIARRTFVGNAYKIVKDPNLIGKMSGHAEGSRAFNRYRRIEEDDLREVIKMINEAS